MTLSGWMWLAAGLLLGVFHSTMLWKSAKQPNPWTALIGIVRVFAVGAVLVGAALSGEIYPAFLGWAAGFFGCVLIVCIGRAK